MYTFGILAAFFLILSGIIFKGRIKDNQFTVGLIVFAGTLVGMSIVNGIIGMDNEYILTQKRVKELPVQYSEIITSEGDTLLNHDTFLEYKYIQEIEEDGDTSLTNFIDVGYMYDHFSPSSVKNSSNISGRNLIIEFLPESDSIPYFEIKKYKRITDNKWVSSFGLPKGGRVFVAYIPNDSIHSILMNQINEKFFENEAEELAQLD